MLIEIEPMGYVRRTRADSWKKRPVVLNYYAYMDELRLKLRNFELSSRYRIVFGIPFPKSYNEKKRTKLDDTPHMLRPDLDNLIKAFQDAMLKEDGMVYEIHAKKLWSRKGYICVENIFI